MTLKGSEYEAEVEDVQKYADILKGRGALPFRGLAKQPSVSYYLFSNVWGLADTKMGFAKHFPLNLSTGISWVEFNCFIDDSFALY